MKWRYLSVFLLLPLGGCVSDQKQHLAQCEYEAAKTYPNYLNAPMGQPQALIDLCMAAAGYEFTPNADPRCNEYAVIEGIPSLYGAFCFTPASTEERLFYKMEVALTVPVPKILN